MSIKELSKLPFKFSLKKFIDQYHGFPQPSECGQQRTLNIVHAQTAAQQQSNGIYEARMSGKCGEWRD